MSEERKCAWCGADISHRRSNARFCGSKCKGRKHTFEQSVAAGYFPSEMFGPRPPVECPICGNVSEQSSGGKTYCKKDGPCSRKAARERAKSRGYFDQPHVRSRMNLAARKHYHEGGGAEYAARWNKSENGKQRKMASRRKAAAKAAIATLILPISKPNQD